MGTRVRSGVCLAAVLLTTFLAAAEPAGSVAIVPGESNRLAGPLRSLFEKEGFAVTMVPWQDFRPGRLDAGKIDLVVLADVRRMPTTAVEATVSFLRSRGKLIAVGAPAFGQLLIKTPGGYVSEERYGEVLYGMLSKRAISLPSAAWTRGAYEPRRVASIEPASSEGGADASRAWKVTMDLDGWDHFSQSIEGAFAGGHTLLCFRARGDADTPQLSIECTERDQSRWIATVDLSVKLRSYVLRPAEFGHWSDSPAKRGGPGDRFNPANVAAIRIGLSQSHTPQCRPGMHAFWFQEMSTAADPNVEEPDLHVPDVQGLCPSYMLYPLVDTKSLRPAHVMALPLGDRGQPSVDFAGGAYSSVWREGGIGFDRGRAHRWVRVLDAYDTRGRNRGTVVWLMLGETAFPGAIWANIGLADPACIASETPEAEALRATLLSVARAITRGCFLLEAGSRHFSYHLGETVELGALVMNAGRREASLGVSLNVADADGNTVFEKVFPLSIPPDGRREIQCRWTPDRQAPSQFPYTVTARLFPGAEAGKQASAIDAVSHRIDLLSRGPARPEELVRVEGSQFMLGGKPWYMLGVNYRPTSQGGRPTLRMFRRDLYDPVIIERDLAWMESIGINTLSAIFAPTPPDPDAPGAYRDLQDFLERCRRHGMKVFYFLPWGNPLPKANLDAIKRHIDAAGLKDHPAILAWELAWEPIYYNGPANGAMDFLLPAWNDWILQRYGSIASAEDDWDFKLPRAPLTSRRRKPQTAAETVAFPDPQWCSTHGRWDRAVAAFRRFFSDHVGRSYGDLIRELRRYDPNHLVTFRFGACGIPDKSRFAHAHSAAVAKHVSFLCPEGYNLQTGGWATPTPADDLRKGGLVTLYYRFLSREKPVVWMEFGYTVNGFHTKWQTGREHVSPEELARQRTEYESFYKMFLESGARGAAPWWLPGGFRVGENSDFGILEPDGTERPVCEVLRRYQPRFAKIPHRPSVATGQTDRRGSQPCVITLDLDAHYADAWDFYSPQYLEAVRSGHPVHLRTEGTGTTSADCPLVAVGNTPLSGHNPSRFLNAEFTSVEVKVADDTPWREIRRGEVLAIPSGTEVRCRASVGNVAEATWLAPKTAGAQNEDGAVYLRCHVGPSGAALNVPISADAPYLGDAEVGEFTLPLSPHGQQTVTLEMLTTRTAQGSGQVTIPFGERRSVAVKVLP